MNLGQRLGHTSRHVVVPWQDSLHPALVCIEWVATSNARRKLVWLACWQVPSELLDIASRPGRLIKGKDSIWRPPSQHPTGGRVTTVTRLGCLGAGHLIDNPFGDHRRPLQFDLSVCGNLKTSWGPFWKQLWSYLEGFGNQFWGVGGHLGHLQGCLQASQSTFQGMLSIKLALGSHIGHLGCHLRTKMLFGCHL